MLLALAAQEFAGKLDHIDTLNVTPDMLASLTHQADATSVRVGFGKPYAAFHEWGTEHMPRRGLLFDDPDAGTLAEGDEAAVLDIIGVWLDGLTS